MKDDLGDRMKLEFESVSQTCLKKKTPVIIRIDGRSFSRFCKRFKKPYDENLHSMLNNVTKYLCNNIQGAKFAERHSDEISILLTDYSNPNSDAFFGYKVQKICSVVSSMATMAFIKELSKSPYLKYEEDQDKDDCYLKYDDNWPQFDARCFNLPENEVPNYFYWRVLDSKRNSVQMYTRTFFSDKQVHGKNCNEMKEMMLNEKSFNWEDLPQERKTGFMSVERVIEKIVPNGPDKGKKYNRNDWSIVPMPGDVVLIREETKKLFGE